MTTLKGLAPAKVNLNLHITGQRKDGYHTLDSLVVFADIGDQITVTAAPDLRLNVSGPFAEGVPTDHTNIVIKAADVLRNHYGISNGATIDLEKFLPNAAGLGGGSTDAAITLSMLAQIWGVPELPPNMPEILGLGADVPVCICAPEPVRMTGIGEVIHAVPGLPDFAMVLVNPKVPVPTADIFKALTSKTNPPLSTIPSGLDFDGFITWLSEQRNDLQPPACEIAPEIQSTLDKIGVLPQVRYTGMSGSGATCFGIVKNMVDARSVARALQVREMNWWVVPAQALK